MQQNQPFISKRAESALVVNSVLKNTYFLLSLTLIFSAITAGLTMLTNAKGPGILLFIIGMFGLSYLVSATRNSGWGIVSAFAFTGFMGYALGPIINSFLHSFVNGGQIVMTAMAGTGVIFLALSGYALTTKKDFNYLGGFLFSAVLVAFLAGVGAALFNIPMLQLLVSAVFALISSALILFHTSQIIHGGERNYIMATISIYVALFNLFVSLLQLLGAFGGNRN